jgi:predicted nuclease with TOPRIM domain
MNRSILIVICDFLLLSLLAFSSVDINKVADKGSAQAFRADFPTNSADSGKDLAAVMRMSLDEERKKQDQLLGELTRTRGSLADRESQIQTVRQQLQSREQEAQRLAGDQTNLWRQFNDAQTRIASLDQRLQATSSDATSSKEKLAALEAEARRKADEAAALKEQLAKLEKSNQSAQAEKQRLSDQLVVAEADRRNATQQVAKMEQEIQVERQEKARLSQQAEKLADGVKSLANKSGELATEIRDNRPLAPNAIFSQFVTNRIQTTMAAIKTGFLGFIKRKDTETILVTDGTNTYALCHVQDTPLSLSNPSQDWDELTGGLNRSQTALPVRSITFCLPDPRLVFIPLTPTEVRQLGCKVYSISNDPFKFQDAVLVGARDGYYGECKFEMDLSTPGYVKLDRNVLKGLFGKFNPSRGDLVFSKTGELLGVMANNTYCLQLKNFDGGATIRFGDDVPGQHTGALLAQLYKSVAEMPFKLQ